MYENNIGPIAAELLALADANARLSVAMFRCDDALPDDVRADLEGLVSDYIEEREDVLSHLARRYGRDTADRTLAMVSAAMMRSAARVMEMDNDGL
jgi:hypothetical protein